YDESPWSGRRCTVQARRRRRGVPEASKPSVLPFVHQRTKSRCQQKPEKTRGCGKPKCAELTKFLACTDSDHNRSNMPRSRCPIAETMDGSILTIRRNASPRGCHRVG